MRPWSIVTIVKNRGAHLRRLIHSAEACCPSASEIVVVDMSDEPVAIDSEVPIKFVRFETQFLSLAEARNIGAKCASHQHIVFLDVDCVPRRNLIGVMDELVTPFAGIVCSEVRYLGPQFSAYDDEVEMMRASRPHPLRMFPANGTRYEDNYGLFWSLLFAVRKDVFDDIGGFDTCFVGYGAEDTDFAFRAREMGISLLFTGRTGAFHQYHQIYNPPLQHFSDIVSNARYFYDKWGCWPMSGWLEQFERMGYISHNNDLLVVVRNPTPEEIAASRQPAHLYF